jgi:hypothetical protein
MFMWKDRKFLFCNRTGFEIVSIHVHVTSQGMAIISGETMTNINKNDPNFIVAAVLRWLCKRCFLGWCDGMAVGALIAISALHFDADFAAAMADKGRPITEAITFLGLLANYFGAMGFILMFLLSVWKLIR